MMKEVVAVAGTGATAEAVRGEGPAVRGGRGGEG